MYSLFNHYFFSADVNMAKNQVDFYQQRIKKIKEKKNMEETEKADKIDKIDFTIKCIKYSFSL
tara:strand:+ start:378 stop:566 length:189 start_codon:yes stop_codon:yes gene_type:complete